MPEMNLGGTQTKKEMSSDKERVLIWVSTSICFRAYVYLSRDFS